MSTRSSIAIKINGEYHVTYCHFDGYFNGVGKELLTKYTTTQQVLDLINEGDHSTLETSYASRGEKDTEPRVYYTAEKYLEHEAQEYDYLFDAEDETWHFHSLHYKEDGRLFRPLTLERIVREG